MVENTYDIGAVFVAYNFVIGILLILASRPMGDLAAKTSAAYAVAIARLTRVAVSAFGAAVAVLFGTIYVVFHVLRIGVN